MSTPLKALIQERLRAKMVCRRTNYDDDYECGSDHLLRQPMDVTAYDITSREDESDTHRSTSSRGSASRRTAPTQPGYPIRLHTHIDQSAYLVPSQHDERCHPPYGSSATSEDDPNRPRSSRYPREQNHSYDPPPRLEQQHHQRERRRHQSHHRIREQVPPRYEPPSRGGYISRQPSQNRGSVSPWHRSEYASTPSKANSTTRSPSNSVHAQSPRVDRDQSYNYSDHFDHDEYARHHRDIKSSPGFAASSSSSHQIRHQDHYQRQRYTWRDRDYNNHEGYEMREPSPTRHHENHEHHKYQPFDKSIRQSPVQHKLPNQSETSNSSRPISTEPSSIKTQPETFEQGRHTAPQLDMKIIELPAKTTGRTRSWDEIMSPESRLAAKAFVEKRQRRTEKSTPRTIATQRWLEVVDARASRHEAAAK
ncbi:hypothetical protein V7S43_009295 [Phytophthora oleae]|uniref:Uncharacterized protein n=1 Tax=Phytophthora oleae TaxID=2107226 RepID=A0ABD3FHH1_9STRA